MDISGMIGLHSVIKLAIIFGLAGIAFSLLLLIWPAGIGNLSRIVNRSFDIDTPIAYVDRILPFDVFYKHHIGFGICLLVGSLTALVFVMAKTGGLGLSSILYSATDYPAAQEMLFSVFAMIGVVVSLIGIALGALLILVPQKMRALEQGLNFWFETKPFFNRLDRSIYGLDTLMHRYPVFLGLAGLIFSSIVLIISIGAFLSE